MQIKRIAWLLAASLVGLSVVVTMVVLLQKRMETAKVRPLPTATVLQRVQTLSQFVSVKYVLEKVVVYEDPKFLGGLIPLGENRVILLAHGEVKAGVDFSKLTAADVRVNQEEVTLRIPPAIVTDAYLVEPRTEVLDWKTGLLAPFDKQLEQTARRYALAEITHAARQSGIETEATERARTQLVAFLQALGFKKVEVEIKKIP